VELTLCATDASDLDILPESVQTMRGVVEVVVVQVVEEEMMAKLCATAATGRVTLLVSVLKEMGATLVEECATAVTGLVTLQGSALREREVIQEEEEEQFAIAATGQAILQGNVQRQKEVAEEVEATFATAVTGLDTLQGSALREMERAEDLAETLVAVAALGREGIEMEAGGMEDMVDLNATSATGLATLPASVGRRKTAATNAMALVILQETAGRKRRPATTATGWVMW